MAVPPEFGRKLRELREAGGVESAYRFFQEAGGARALGLTYKHYLKIENGGLLPRVDKFAALAKALGIYDDPSRLGEFAASYVRSLFHDPKVSAALERGSAAAPVLGQVDRKAVRLFQGREKNLTTDDARFLVETEARYRALHYLLITEKDCSAAEIAAFWALSEKEIGVELSALKARRFAVRGSKGTWRAAHLHVRWPASTPSTRELVQKRKRIAREAESRAADTLVDRVGFIISRRELIDAYSARAADVFELCPAYSSDTAGEADGAYSVRVSVRRVVPFR